MVHIRRSEWRGRCIFFCGRVLWKSGASRRTTAQQTFATGPRRTQAPWQASALSVRSPVNHEGLPVLRLEAAVPVHREEQVRLRPEAHGEAPPAPLPVRAARARPRRTPVNQRRVPPALVVLRVGFLFLRSSKHGAQIVGLVAGRACHDYHHPNNIEERTHLAFGHGLQSKGRQAAAALLRRAR